MIWKISQLAQILEHLRRQIIFRFSFLLIVWNKSISCYRASFSVIFHRRHRNVVRTSITHSPVVSVPLFCFYHTLTSSVTSQKHGNTESVCNKLKEQLNLGVKPPFVSDYLAPISDRRLSKTPKSSQSNHYTVDYSWKLSPDKHLFVSDRDQLLGLRFYGIFHCFSLL